MNTKIKKISRRKELVIKGTHLLLRLISMSPEVRQARSFTKKIRQTPEKFMNSSLGGQRILIASMRDWAVHVHVEAMLGHILALSGAEVQHMTCGGGLAICDRVNTWEGPPMPCKSCTKYVESSLRAHDSKFSSLSLNWGESAWPEIDNLSLEELKNVTYKGLALGSLVEIPVKWFLLGETLSEDPLGTSTYRTFLRSAKLIADSAVVAIDEYQPDQVLMLNGLFLFESIIWEICRLRNISVVTYERSFILDSFVFARDDGAGFCKVDDVWPEWKIVELSTAENGELDSYLNDRQLGLRTSDDYWKNVRSAKHDRRLPGAQAVLFTNLVWDSAVLRQDVAFSSIVDWIVACIEEFRGRPDDELVIRIHPAETKLSGRESREEMESAIVKRVPNLPPNVVVIPSSDAVSSYELMREADFGLVYSSTTGLEMVLTGKPVVVAAKTHYREKGFTIDIETPSQLIDAVNQLCSRPTSLTPDLKLARKYAYLFFFRSPLTGLGVEEPIRGLVALTVDSSEALIGETKVDVQRFITAMAERTPFNPLPATNKKQSLP